MIVGCPSSLLGIWMSLISNPMSYDYKTEKPLLFTEEGVTIFIGIRDNVNRLIKEAGAIRAQEAMLKVSGSIWTMMAALDRMVELGELKELTTPDAMGQYRVFVKPYSDC